MVGTKDDDAAIVAKYRTTPQFKRALEIISPAPERRVQCEHEIVHGILRVILQKEDDKYTPAVTKKKREKQVKKLRAAAAVLWDDPLKDQLKFVAKLIEEDAASIVVSPGKPKYSLAKSCAVIWAHRLLTVFGSSPPTRYRDGAWHKLAKVLFGESKDLFDYVSTTCRRPPPDYEKRTAPRVSLTAMVDMIGQRQFW